MCGPRELVGAPSVHLRVTGSVENPERKLAPQRYLLKMSDHSDDSKPMRNI